MSQRGELIYKFEFEIFSYFQIFIWNCETFHFSEYWRKQSKVMDRKDGSNSKVCDNWYEVSNKFKVCWDKLKWNARYGEKKNAKFCSTAGIYIIVVDCLYFVWLDYLINTRLDELKIAHTGLWAWSDIRCKHQLYYWATIYKVLFIWLDFLNVFFFLHEL